MKCILQPFDPRGACRGVLFEQAPSLRRSTKHREHPRRHFRFCYVRMERARARMCARRVQTHTHTHIHIHTKRDRGASSSTLNHVRLSPTDARARARTPSDFSRGLIGRCCTGPFVKATVSLTNSLDICMPTTPGRGTPSILLFP